MTEPTHLHPPGSRMPSTQLRGPPVARSVLPRLVSPGLPLTSRRRRTQARGRQVKAHRLAMTVVRQLGARPPPPRERIRVHRLAMTVVRRLRARHLRPEKRSRSPPHPLRPPLPKPVMTVVTRAKERESRRSPRTTSNRQNRPAMTVATRVTRQTHPPCPPRRTPHLRAGRPPLPPQPPVPKPVMTAVTRAKVRESLPNLRIRSTRRALPAMTVVTRELRQSQPPLPPDHAHLPGTPTPPAQRTAVTTTPSGTISPERRRGHRALPAAMSVDTR